MSVPAYSLVGLFRSREDMTNCSVLRLNVATGDNETLALSDACAGILQNYPAFSALSPDGRSLAVVIASAKSLVALDTDSGATRALAPLPAYDDADGYLGLAWAPGGAAPLLLTRSALWTARGGALVQLAGGFAFGEICLVAAGAGGTGGAGLLFVADEAGASIAVLDLGASPAPAIVRTLRTGASSPWDLQYDAARDRLLVLTGYRLYAVNAQSGATKQLMAIPDGPGYPRVNCISPDGSTFTFLDFSFIYTVDLATDKIVGKAPFLGAPRVMGYPAWSANTTFSAA